MGISVAVSFVADQISKAINYQKEMIATATALTSTYKEDANSLDVVIKKYEELKNKIDAGVLSREEERLAKEQLLGIQDQLVEKYGDELDGINLVNGGLREQLGLLGQLSKEKANEYIVKNANAFAIAKKELEKEKKIEIDPIRIEFTDDIENKIDAIVQKYENMSITKGNLDVSGDTLDILSGNSKTFGDVWFKVQANPEDAKSTLESLYLDIEQLGKDTGVNVSSALAHISKETNKQWVSDLAEYQTVYDEYVKAQVMQNDTLRPLYGASIKAVEDYNSALADGDHDKIKDTGDALNVVKARVSDATKEVEGTQSVFDHLFNVVDKGIESAYRFKEVFTSDSALKQFAEDLKGLTDIDLSAIKFDDSVVSNGEESFAKLKESAEQYGLSSERLIDILVELGYVQGQAANQTGNLSYALDDISNELSSFNNEITKLYGQYDAVNAAVAEFNEYGAISAATFKSLSDNNLLQYLEFTANGLQVNSEKLLQNEQSLKDQTLATLKAALGKDLLALATKEASDEAVNAQTSIAGAGNNAETAAQKFANAAIGAADLAGALAAVNAVASGQELDLSGKQDRAKALIDQYQKTAAAIDNIKFSTSSTSNQFGGFSTAANKAASAAKSAADEIKKAMSSAQSAIQSLLSMTINVIKQQLNDQKKAIQSQLDALSKRYNTEKKHLDNIAKEKKKQYDDEKKALQNALEGYRKKINAQIELLRAKENERDYQSELSEKQKDVADLKAEMAANGLDRSDAGIRRQLELEAQLAEKRKELDEFQHDKSIEDQEDTLNKELTGFEENINQKLDLLEIESQRYEEMHQERLEQNEAEYEHKRERLEAQQKDIEEKVSNEALIRAEAIKLVEDKNSDLYQKLLEWNKQYGTMIDADVRVAWDNAYASMDKFNGAQLGVQGVLEHLVTQMNEFEKSIDRAARKMQNLTDDAIGNKNAAENQSQPSDNSGRSSKQSTNGTGFKTGGIITKDRAVATNVDGESDAVLIKAHVGETVLPVNDHKRSMRLLADYVNGNQPLSSIMTHDVNMMMNSLPYQHNAMGIGTSNLQNYERINNVGGDTKVEVIVQGNMDKSVLPDMERMIDRKLHENAKRQVNAITSRGGGFNAAKRGF